MIQLPAVAMLLVAALLACSNIAQAASPLSASSSTTPRLCIMNEARYHHEVVLGLIKTFASEYGKDMLFYGETHYLDGVDEFWADVLPASRMKEIQIKENYPVPCDVVIIATAEYNWKGVQERVLKVPWVKVVIMVVHEWQDIPNDIYDHHPNLYLFGLAPHVAQRLTERFNRTAYWWLPTAALDIRSRCGTQGGSKTQCLSGFAVQGNIAIHRRNYKKLFDQFSGLLNRTNDPRAELLLVGKLDKEPRNVPTIPATVSHRTKIISDLQFPKFYETLHHSLVLMPQIVDERYLRDRFTSSVITSLTAGVPMLVDTVFIKTYSYLKPKHIYRQALHESETDTMVRILSMSDQEHTQRRAALADLRLRLQADARRKLRMLVEPFLPQIAERHKQQPISQT